jgi:hypothetical protein
MTLKQAIKDYQAKEAARKKAEVKEHVERAYVYNRLCNELSEAGVPIDHEMTIVVDKPSIWIKGSNIQLVFEPTCVHIPVINATLQYQHFGQAAYHNFLHALAEVLCKKGIVVASKQEGHGK